MLRKLMILSFVATLIWLSPVTLAQTTLTTTGEMTFSTRSGHNMTCKAGTPVTIDSKGHVVTGTLARDTAWPTRSGSNMNCMGGTTVTFDEKGFVVTGTLARDTAWPTRSGFNMNCMGGTKVTFDKKGYLIIGTLAHDTAWQDSNDSNGNYKAGTTLTLDAKGRVNKSGSAGASSNRAPEGSSHHPNLSGKWRCVWEAKNWTGESKIEQEGEKVHLYPPVGSESAPIGNAQFENSKTFEVPEWKVRGTITDDGNTIRWDNGSYWERR